MSWVPAPKGDSRAQSVCDLLNQYEGIRETVHKLLTHTCPRFALGLFDAAKVDYERQGLYNPFLKDFPIRDLPLSIIPFKVGTRKNSRQIVLLGTSFLILCALMWLKPPKLHVRDPI